MEKHLLVTIGDELSSLHGVRFVGSFFQNKSSMKLTLLYVSSMPLGAGGAADLQQRKLDAAQTEASLEKGRKAMEEAKKILTLRGFSQESIDTKLITRRLGTVKDIVHEGRTGLFDAVVLGRRGFAVFEKALSGSVTREIMEHRIAFPLWISKRPEEGRKDILLCVDESDPSLRIADHVGFMAAQEEHRVTLLHVDSGEGRNVDKILLECRKMLTENGVPEERIHNRILRGQRVAATILEEAEKGHYAAVAVGRGGSQPKGLIKRWLVGGSTSMKLLESLEKAALWVSK